MKYLKQLFLSKIQRIEERHIDDGMMGRLLEDEVIAAFNSLKLQIQDAEELFDDDRAELIEIIEEKIRETPNKEEEICKKETQDFEKRKQAISNAKRRFDCSNPIIKMTQPFPEERIDFMSTEEIDSLYPTKKEPKDR